MLLVSVGARLLYKPRKVGETEIHIPHDPIVVSEQVVSACTRYVDVLPHARLADKSVAWKVQL